MSTHKNPWLSEAKSTITLTKLFLANFSVYVRKDQYEIFEKLFKPKATLKILDVGVTSDKDFKDSNMFEKLYLYLNDVVAATIENPLSVKRMFPKIKKVVRIKAGRKLPFKNRQFDIVVSWATLEHVGGYEEQKFFLEEIDRVGKSFFITTPYRGCIYEPHSGFFFLHWLPLPIFRKLCKFFGKTFWSKEANLNPLYVKDIEDIKPRKIGLFIYKTFGIIRSHLIIYAKK